MTGQTTAAVAALRLQSTKTTIDQGAGSRAAMSSASLFVASVTVFVILFLIYLAVSEVNGMWNWSIAASRTGKCLAKMDCGAELVELHTHCAKKLQKIASQSYFF